MPSCQCRRLNQEVSAVVPSSPRGPQYRASDPARSSKPCCTLRSDGVLEQASEWKKAKLLETMAAL